MKNLLLSLALLSLSACTSVCIEGENNEVNTTQSSIRTSALDVGPVTEPDGG